MTSQPKLLIVPNQKFLDTFREEIVKSMEIVTDHEGKGENQLLPITAMFPYGEKDLLGIIFTKVARCIGYELAGNLPKVREEVQDIINYAGFLLAYIRLKE